MRGYCKLLGLYLTVLVAVQVSLMCSAQEIMAETEPEMALVLQPKEFIGGIPRSFEVIITNRSGNDLWLPDANGACSGVPFLHGSMVLNEDWRPPDGSKFGRGQASCCGAGTGAAPPALLDQAKKWKVLHAGESTYLELSSRFLGTMAPDPGVYTFSVSYTPAAWTKEEASTLQAARIVTPHIPATSASLVYRKEVDHP